MYRTSIFLLLALVTTAHAAKNTQVLMNFSGKSSGFFWDLGVSRGVAKWLENEPKELYFAGNSSGAFFAAYFGCWGMNEQTVQEGFGIAELVKAEYLGPNALVRYSRMALTGKTEEPILNMKPALLKTVYRNGQRCDRPQFPLLIPSMRGDVLEDILYVEHKALLAFGKKTIRPSFYEGRGDKQLAQGTLDVFGKDEAGQFAKPLGKGCTYFVSRPMMDFLLSRTTADKLMCDLYEIKSANDLLLAIYSSIAEPTFFHPVNAKAFEPLATDGPAPEILANPDLYYVGGFGFPIPGRDVQPLLNAFSIGTSMGVGLSDQANAVLRNWYHVSVNDNLARDRAQLDIEVWSPTIASGIYLTREKGLAAADEATALTLKCLEDHSLCPSRVHGALSVQDELRKKADKK